MMSKHQANHVQVAYAKSTESADDALLARAAFAQAIGLWVNVCGTKVDSSAWASSQSLCSPQHGAISNTFFSGSE